MQGPPDLQRVSALSLGDRTRFKPVDLKRLSARVGKAVGAKRPEDLCGGHLELIPANHLEFVRHLSRGVTESVDLAVLRESRDGATRRRASTAAAAAGDERSVEVSVSRLRSAAFTEHDIALFVRGAEAMLRLSCDYVLGVYGLGVDRPEPTMQWPSLFVVGEYATDGTLKEALEAQHEDPLRPVYRLDEALDWAIDLAGALSYLHSPGVGMIHRDLRSANVHLVRDPRTESLTAKVGGFSLHTPFESPAPRPCDALATLEWQRGLANDSFCYRAPEALAEEGYTERVDVFSLGAVLYELFMRRSLYLTLAGQGDTWTPARYAEHFAEGFRMPLADKLPPEIKALIRECMANDPDERPDAEGVLRVLHSVRADGSISRADALFPGCCAFM